MSTGLEVRKALPTDAAAIALIQVAAWETAYRGSVDDKALDDALSSDLEAAWRNEISTDPEAKVLVVELDGDVVGYARLGPSREDDAEAGTGEVYGLYVHPEQWGTGVAPFLFAHVEEQLRLTGFTEATLWVLAANPRAQRFYEKHGWRSDGRDDKPFLGGARQLRYRKEHLTSAQ